MTAPKRLYFIPIIARALASDNPREAMEEAFEEIRALGNQPEYGEGFRQFIEFVKTTLRPTSEESEHRVQLARDAIYHLIYDLATDTFEGEQTEREALIHALRGIPEWNAEYERIQSEARAFLAPETPINIEVLQQGELISSFISSIDTHSIGPIRPGRYTVRFSNGRILWEGALTKEDLIWSFAFPEQDLPMAAETDLDRREPSKVISLLDGELVVEVFAGLESGEMRIKRG
jgi:hypothetical protein